MKKGENLEYDKLRDELFNIRVKLKTELNLDKEVLNNRITEILNEMKKLELENIKKKG